MCCVLCVVCCVLCVVCCAGRCTSGVVPFLWPTLSRRACPTLRDSRLESRKCFASWSHWCVGAACVVCRSSTLMLTALFVLLTRAQKDALAGACTDIQALACVEAHLAKAVHTLFGCRKLDSAKEELGTCHIVWRRIISECVRVDCMAGSTVGTCRHFCMWCSLPDQHGTTASGVAALGHGVWAVCFLGVFSRVRLRRVAALLCYHVPLLSLIHAHLAA